METEAQRHTFAKVPQYIKNSDSKALLLLSNLAFQTADVGTSHSRKEK
jgi:hypothetical protein